MRLTKEKYKCNGCQKEEFLIVVYNRGCLCKECYKDKLIKTKCIKEMNKLYKGGF